MGRGGRTTELDTEVPLELAEDLRTWDGLAGLIILDDGRLLVDLLCELLLRELLIQTGGLDSLLNCEVCTVSTMGGAGTE